MPPPAAAEHDVNEFPVIVTVQVPVPEMYMPPPAAAEHDRNEAAVIVTVEDSINIAPPYD